jgi:hypothetical protein
MTVSANSYGTASGVAGRVRVLTTGSAVAGTFDTLTIPTLANVESWINQFSAILNSALASARFVVPITQEDCVVMCGGVVEDAVADMANWSRGVGRFFSDAAQTSGKSAQGTLRKEIYDWVATNALGMENLGAERSAEETGVNEAVFGTLDLNFGARGNDLGITS